jgi:hypothetical protein
MIDGTFRGSGNLGRPVLSRRLVISPSPSAPIERTFTLVGEQGDLIAQIDKSHFDQCPEIVRTDRHKFCALAFDIAQYPAEMDRRFWI